VLRVMTEDDRHQEVLDEVHRARVAHGERQQRLDSRAHRAARRRGGSLAVDDKIFKRVLGAIQDCFSS
jgi:hypothetical protein